jgi:aspartyl-tRNA(Asn)/glutamyl-tRNA(Gln) amidotransferase subunit B
VVGSGPRLTRLAISGTSGRNVLRHILQTKTTVSVSQLIDELSLRTVDSFSVEALCDEAIRKFPEEVELIHGGKKNILMKLVGYVMKASRGSADAKLTRQILEQKLAARR